MGEDSSGPTLSGGLGISTSNCFQGKELLSLKETGNPARLKHRLKSWIGKVSFRLQPPRDYWEGKQPKGEMRFNVLKTPAGGN